MIDFKNRAAQGDILIRRIESLPKDAVKQDPINGHHVVAHSETGHHHTIQADGVNLFVAANDDKMIMYLVVDSKADLIHNRSFDTHKPLRFDAGVYEIRRQREYSPRASALEGWRRVED